MSKSSIIILSVSGLLAIAGCFIGGFGGGYMTGMCVTLVLLSTIGQHQANKAAARIDKKIRDRVTNPQTQDDGN